MTELTPTIERLEDQLGWYERRSKSARRWFRWLKLIQIILAAIIPFLAGYGAPPILTGSAGVIIIVLESIQQLCQLQHNWMTYRSTCESLKHEKYLHLGKAGPYKDAATPETLLAERIEALISREHAQWVGAQKDSGEVKRRPY